MTGPGPYEKAVPAGVASALLAAMVVAGVDIAWTLASASEVTARQALLFAAIALALALAAGAVVGAIEGVIGGAVRATHPRGLVARLREDHDADRAATGALLAALVAGALYAVVVAGLAMRLVAAVERKGVGALLLGAAAAAALPFVWLAAYPIYRVTRRLAGAVPRVGRVPRALVAATVVVLVAVAGAAAVIVLRLDWRVLPLAAPVAALGFVAVQLVLLAVRKPPWPAKPAIAAAVLALGAAAALVLAARPDERTTALLAVDSRVTRALVAPARGLFDGEGDGFAGVLGGGDCDDARADVFPGARDVPDNGVDENCLGGDARRETRPPDAALQVPTAPSRKVAFDGNVLIIAVDTLRFDKLGATHRGGKSLTPRMDELARRGVSFRRAYAQAPNTPRSFPSLFLSRFPSQIVWDDSYRNYPVVKDENVSLWEVLSGAGIHTAGVASHFYFTEERGIRQGFAEFDNEGATSIKDSNPDIAAPRIVPRATAKLEELVRGGKRFALMVHLFEPHSTYVTHPEFPIQSRGVEGLEEKYDYEIAYVDRWVGVLVDAVAKAGAAETTAIVIVSDHGEAFGKHRVGGERMFFHGQTLYEELIHVPLIVTVPGVAPRAVDTPVMLIDVAPTLADLLGVAQPPSFTGRSLVPALAGETLPPRPVHAELLPAPSWNHHAKSMLDVDGKTKIIYRVSDNVFELYDLGADPDEEKNLWAERKEDAERMKAAITRWMESEL